MGCGGWRCQIQGEVQGNRQQSLDNNLSGGYIKNNQWFKCQHFLHMAGKNNLQHDAQ